MSWEQLRDKDRVFFVRKFEELMGHMQKELHYNVSNEKDRAIVDHLAARAIATSESVLEALENSKNAGVDGVEIAVKIAESDGGGNVAKARRDGSPRRRSRSRSLSSARAGAEMIKPLRQAAPLAERREPGSSSTAGGSDAASQSARATPAVAHGGMSSGREANRGEGGHSVGGKRKIKRTASGNLLLKIAAGSVTVGIVRVVVAVVATVLRGRAEGREGPEAMARGDQGRAVGTEGDGKAGPSPSQRPGKASDGLEKSAT